MLPGLLRAGSARRPRPLVARPANRSPLQAARLRPRAVAIPSARLSQAPSQESFHSQLESLHQCTHGVDYSFYADMRNEEVTEDFLWSRLEPSIGHLTSSEQETLREALVLAMRAHDGQLRKSGEPFITHPVEVTRILGDIRAELEMLCAGLLHDTVEDTDVVNFVDIGELFGSGCQRIVEGETKFSKLTKLDNTTSKEELKAMDLQQLFLAMTEDARIIIVKLADRLHNMRTMASMPPHKQAKIANETLRVFAPLAGLLGLWQVKVELEDLSLQYSMPQVFAFIERHRTKTFLIKQAGLAEADRMLRERMQTDVSLQMAGLAVEVRPSIRSVYSLYMRAKETIERKSPRAKLEAQPERKIIQQLRRSRVLESVTDVVKFYLIVDRSGARAATAPAAAHTSSSASGSHQCYQVLGALHALWPPVPGSIKDYISTPKQNGYQGLHSSLRTIGCTKIGSVEIIVHTKGMHQRANFGIAADAWPRPLAPARAAPAPTDTWDPLGLVKLVSHHLGNGSNGAAAAQRNGSNGAGGAVDGGRDGGGAEMRPAGAAAAAAAPGLERAYHARLGSVEMSRRVKWLESIRQWQEEFLSTVTASQFMEVMQQDLLGRTVFVFTPAGDIMRLPRGATVVDFAYHVHTAIGNSMVSARVNGVIELPSYELCNADVVDIVRYSSDASTAGHVKRHRSWLPLARTQSARYKIQKFVREQEKVLADPSSSGGEPSSRADDGGGGASATPAEAAETWLCVSCRDRHGLLADVAVTFAKYNLNIVTYNGGNRSEGSEDAYMHFLLDAPRSQLDVVRIDVLRIPAVTGAQFGMPAEHLSDW